jgi:hypothetical protein
MSFKKSISFVAFASIAGVIAFGCSSSSTTSSSSGGTDTDGSVATPDSGKKDSGGTGSDGGGTDADTTSCVALTSVSGFTPKWTPPAAHQDVCSQQNIDDFRKFCLGTGDANACNSFLATATGKACAQCILTSPTAAALGPLVDHSKDQGFVSLNTAGCIALATGDTTANGCGAKVLALSQCDDAACVNCKVTDDASLALLNQCTQDAEGAACASYAGPAGCADQLAEAGTASQCFGGTDFDSGYNSIVPIFCLKSADAGTD